MTNHTLKQVLFIKSSNIHNFKKGNNNKEKEKRREIPSKIRQTCLKCHRKRDPKLCIKTCKKNTLFKIPNQEYHYFLYIKEEENNKIWLFHIIECHRSIINANIQFLCLLLSSGPPTTCLQLQSISCNVSYIRLCLQTP